MEPKDSDRVQKSERTSSVGDLGDVDLHMQTKCKHQIFNDKPTLCPSLINNAHNRIERVFIPAQYKGPKCDAKYTATSL